MENLFYSSSEKILFWIPGYAANTGILSNVIEGLISKQAQMRSIVPQGIIYVHEILFSSRYEYMWYFYVETNDIPEDAHILKEDWTMGKWIST